jgi:hypothetical protein
VKTIRGGYHFRERSHTEHAAASMTSQIAVVRRMEVSRLSAPTLQQPAFRVAAVWALQACNNYRRLNLVRGLIHDFRFRVGRDFHRGLNHRLVTSGTHSVFFAHEIHRCGPTRFGLLTRVGTHSEPVASACNLRVS